MELNLQESNHKINLMTRKTNKFEMGESVYIFHSTIQEDNKTIDLYKAGRTKNGNGRDQIHKTASYKGILLQVKCVDSVLLERTIHFLLNKYRMVNRREWFTCSFEIMKNTIEYAKTVLESDIDFEQLNVKNINLPLIKVQKEPIQEPVQKPKTPKNIFTTLQHTGHDINDFDLFISENCDLTDKETSISHITLKNQYKIWSKTAKY